MKCSLSTLCPNSVNGHLFFQLLKLEKRQNNPKPLQTLLPPSFIQYISKYYTLQSSCRTLYVTLHYGDLVAMALSLSILHYYIKMNIGPCFCSLNFPSHIPRVWPHSSFDFSLPSYDIILAECASFLCPRTLPTWDILPPLSQPCGPVYTTFKSLFKYLCSTPTLTLTLWPN